MAKNGWFFLAKKSTIAHNKQICKNFDANQRRLIWKFTFFSLFSLELLNCKLLKKKVHSDVLKFQEFLNKNEDSSWPPAKIHSKFQKEFIPICTRKQFRALGGIQPELLMESTRTSSGNAFNNLNVSWNRSFDRKSAFLHCKIIHRLCHSFTAHNFPIPTNEPISSVGWSRRPAQQFSQMKYK